MADELKHADPGVGLESSAEYTGVGVHVLDSQATGDLVYASSASQLSRLGIGSSNDLLQVVSGIPAWKGITDVLIAMLMRGQLLSIPTNAGWTSVLTGSGAVYGQTPFYNGVNTGTTVSSSALLNCSAYGFPYGYYFTVIDWSKKLYFLFNYSRQTTDVEAVGRVQLKQIDTLGALTDKGIGIRADNFTLMGESYGSALGEVNLGTALVSQEKVTLIIVHDPTVPKIEWWKNVDGTLTLLGTQTTSAAIPQAKVAVVAYLVHSINKSGATTIADAYSYLFRPTIWMP